MERKPVIPDDVLELPADDAGNGFIFHDVWAASVVGSDGNIYTRRAGVITVDEED